MLSNGCSLVYKIASEVELVTEGLMGGQCTYTLTVLFSVHSQDVSPTPNHLQNTVVM
jgi:hypothetical protein